MIYHIGIIKNATDKLVLSLPGMTLWPIIVQIIAIINKMHLNTFVHSEVSIAF